MIYKRIERIGVEVSVVGLGGHEYLANGRSRGFNENSALAVRPGYTFDGFGQEKRKRVLAAAFEHGINFFDVTIDSEKEALGRNLKEIPPPYEIYVQTRPEGMVYSYDPFNAKMAQYDLLKAEVQRGLRLLQRDRLDFLNLGFLQSALDHDPEYLAKIAYNIGMLKKEGLIRFACADTFSGEHTYLEEIQTGCFDALFINLNFADHCALQKVLPLAAERGLGVFAREAFMKGALFRMGDEVGVTDRSALARLALRWNLSNEQVTAVVVGADTPDQLANNLGALESPALSDEEQETLERVKTSPTYKAYERQKREQFGYPV
ncbi:MAG: aldo/keto reductase [Anaerolineae bacterium]|nr:aldo/keto reductase [Anaerolineae bacterium]